MRVYRRLIAVVGAAALLVSSVFTVGVTHTYAESSEQPIETDAEEQQIDLEHIVPGKVIVKFKRTPQGSEISAHSVERIRGARLQALHFSEDVNVFEKIEELEQNPNVEYAEPVYRFYKAGEEADSSAFASAGLLDPSDGIETWGQSVTEAVYAWSYTEQTRGDVTVAVLDTGVDLDHPDLADHLLVAEGANFVANEPPIDRDGHGTHVAGIIGAEAASGSGYTGVAPGVKLLPVKVLDDDGRGGLDDVIEGIQYAVVAGADIINLSLGSPYYSAALHEAVLYAVEQGVLVVAAAGNESNHWIQGDDAQYDVDTTDTNAYASTVSYPAQFEEVLSVGAVSKLDDADGSLTIADFSNIGRVDVAGPGTFIYSTVPNGYRFYSGTSQAAPFAAGIAALIKAYNPDLSLAEWKQVIKDSAIPLDAPDINYVNGGVPNDSRLYYGSGLINAKRAFTMPRLDFDLNTTGLQAGDSVTAQVRLVDASGTALQTSVTGSVYVDSIIEDDPLGAYLWDREAYTALQLDQGVGTVFLTVPEVDVYRYAIYADIAGDYIRSEVYELIQRPAAPVSNLVSGTYRGTRAVTLSSPTPGTTLYHDYISETELELQTEPEWIPYTGSFAVDENGLLFAYAVKNDVVSSTSLYIYEIEPARSGSGNGSGSSRGGSSTPQEETLEDGRTMLEMKPTFQDVSNQLRNEGSVTVEATGDADLLAVEFALSDWNRAMAGGHRDSLVTVRSNGVDVSFPARFIRSAAGSAETLTLKAEKLGETNFGTSFSETYDFALEADGKAISAFPEEITVTFKLSGSEYDPNRIGVFRLNEQTGAWNYVGGSIGEDNTISVELNSFSTYGAFQLDVTFDDIRIHWAKSSIESLAAKQIVTGMTAHSYVPEQSVSRAQFVTLLSRALRLDATGAANPFTDVDSSAWYGPHVLAAFRSGIVNGSSETSFDPNAQLTREQMAKMLVDAYAYKQGISLGEIAITQEVKYSDEGSVSAWARSYVRAANALGLMGGLKDGSFRPQDVTTRAQAAAVIDRLFQQLK